MNSLIWNALCASAVVGLLCSLPFLTASMLRSDAALVPVRAARRRGQRMN